MLFCSYKIFITVCTFAIELLYSQNPQGTEKCPLTTSDRCSRVTECFKSCKSTPITRTESIYNNFVYWSFENDRLGHKFPSFHSSKWISDATLHFVKVQLSLVISEDYVPHKLCVYQNCGQQEITVLGILYPFFLF